MKKCPRCKESKRLSEFGICRARKDGLNLYCKVCIRQKIADHRQVRREYKQARIRNRAAIVAKLNDSVDKKAALSPRRMARMIRKLSPTDRVREAIRLGARTQREIACVARLNPDEFSDALTSLLLWTREIRTSVVNHTRMYFLNDTAEPPAHKSPQEREPRSHGVSTVYFSV